MIRITIGGTDRSGVASMDRFLGVAHEVVGDMRGIWAQVVRPFMLEHMDAQFNTLGAHGGAPWESLDNEPIYRAYKARLLGESLALKVLWWSADREQLRPSLVSPTHGSQVFDSDQKKMFFGTKVPHAGDLISGGIGPFGEPFPGRAIFAMTGAQRKGLVTLMQRAIVQRVEARGFSRSDMRDQL